MKKLFYAVLVFAAVVVLAMAVLRQGSFTYTVKQERKEGPFFRVDVKLDYKGKPHDISYVATCSARITSYVDGSASRDVGRMPEHYGHRMEDGQAIVIPTPEVCNGETTANKWVPENYMPLIIVYEDATTLAFGRAYMTEDAYSSPLSELTFHKATITASSRAEFDEFNRTGTRNVVTRERLFSGLSRDIQKRRGVEQQYEESFGDTCMVAVRFKLSEEKRALLRDLPEFTVGGSWTQREAGAAFPFGGVGTYSNDKDNRQHPYPDENMGSGLGVMRASLDSLIGDPKFRETDKKSLAFPSVYPVNSTDRPGARTSELEAMGKTRPGTNAFIGWNVEFEKDKRGFGYCYDYTPRITAALAERTKPKDQRKEVVLWAENGELIHYSAGQHYNYIYYFQSDQFMMNAGDTGTFGSVTGDVL